MFRRHARLLGGDRLEVTTIRDREASAMTVPLARGT